MVYLAHRFDSHWIIRRIIVELHNRIQSMFVNNPELNFVFEVHSAS
jgi:hypothetical protein